MNRRNFIKGAALASTFPAAIPAAAATAGSSLLVLFQEHEQLYALDSEAWGIISDIVDRNMRDAPKFGVQVSRLLIGYDNEGQKIFQPIIETTEDGIRAHYRETGLRPVTERDKVMNEKLAELEERRAARKQFEDQCGYTAALEAARASAAKVKRVERQIIDYVPANLEEAALKARWFVEKFNDDRSYLQDTEFCLLDALASISAA